MARHKGRKKTLALPNRPKPLGVVRSLTDEFVRTGNGGTGNGRVALLRDREERGMGRFVPVAQERDPPMGPVGGVPVAQERDPPKPKN